MKRETIYISPAIHGYKIIKDMLTKSNFIVLNERKLINNQITLALIEPLNSTTVIESVPLLSKYKLPVVYIADPESKGVNTSELPTDKLIPVLHYTDDIKQLKQSLTLILKLVQIYHKKNSNEMWIKGILNTSSQGIIGINREGKIAFINPVAQQIVGVEEINSIGKDATSIIKFKETNNLLNMSWNSSDNAIEGELYNSITKEFNPISGSFNNVSDIYDNFGGKVFTLQSTVELNELFSKVEYQASHDSLTGLYNRQSYIDKISKYIVLSKMKNTTHGLIGISIDKFKIINDTCGHIAGDELLRKISYILRSLDPDNNYMKARIGGDEFGIFLEEKQLSEIKHFTKNVQRKINSNDFIWGDKEFSVKCSIGISIIDKTSTNYHTQLAELDDACAIAKEKGGNRIEIYNKIDDDYHRRRGEMQWIHKLKDAISNDSFKLYFQEIKSIHDSSYKKIEVLLRLEEENGKIVSPALFIPPAERYGLMEEIDKIVIEKSIIACKELMDNKNITDKYIFSVNISGISIPDRGLPNYIKSMFQKYRVPPTLFCFEITETATVSNIDLAKTFIKSLRTIGCTFSLDDFGSGFSNFSYLKSLEVDYLKIDGSFIHNIAEEPINRSIAESINNIGHSLKLKTIAEFVKDEKVKEIMEDIGVDYIQGYVIGEPTPIDNLLNRNRIDN